MGFAHIIVFLSKMFEGFLTKMNGNILAQSKHSTKEERQVPLIFLLFSLIKNIKFNRFYLDGTSPII